MTVVMMKPTNSCNLHCIYCYNSTNLSISNKDVMSLKTMTEAMTKITKYENDKGRTVTFEWIGGEPLLARMDFYKAVIKTTDALKSNGFKLKHCIQSNGTLMTYEKAQFFFNNGFEVSFSLDGTREINDQTRVYPSQAGTFDKIVKGIRAYKDIAKRCGVVCVVTRLNIEHIQDLYTFCKQEGVGFQLNSLINQGRATNEADKLSITPKEYAEVVLSIFELWLADDKELLGSESRIENAVMSALLEKGGFGTCVDKKTSCQDFETNNFICVNSKGDVYPCTSFDGNSEFWLGNIHDIECFSEIAECSKRKYIAGRNQRIANQDGTSYAGCMHKAYITHGHIDSIDPMVEANNLIQVSVKKRVDSILEQAKI